MEAADNGRPTARYLLATAQAFIDHLTRQRFAQRHSDGWAWNEVPVPARWHRCWPQSAGSCGPFQMIERCPCGGTRIDQTGPWWGRNRRRIFDAPGGVGPANGRENIGDTENDLLLQLRCALRKEPDA